MLRRIRRTAALVLAAVAGVVLAAGGLQAAQTCTTSSTANWVRAVCSDGTIWCSSTYYFATGQTVDRCGYVYYT